MNAPDPLHDDAVAALRALTSYDLGAPRAESVRRRAHEILARRRRHTRAVIPALVAFGRAAEPLFAASLGACCFLWLVARCLQIYGLLPV